jgi:hypothetical protein
VGTDDLAGGPGRGEVTDDMVEEFHKKYDKRLTKAERELLVSWIRRQS